MLKMEAWSRRHPARNTSGPVHVSVPEARRPKQSRIEVRYSPTLAGAMVDALPYLVDYPYGCTEQTLNRFLPTVITQKILLEMRLNLEEIRKKRTNLNAQEIGEDAERAEAVEALRPQPGLRRGRGPQDGQGRRRAADRDAAFRRRLGLVLRLGRALRAAHHGPGGPRPATGPAERRGRRARHDRSRHRVAAALPGRADPADQERRRQGQAASPGRSTPTSWTPSSTWCWWTPA